jgi:DNA polymerase I-like protein with 3'-5' exonuclease and polymerase domains
MYEGDNYLVLDFEVDTSHGDFGHPRHDANHLLLSCFKHHGRSYHHFGDELSGGELLSAISQVDFWVAHNAKYEYGWLKRCGMDLRQLPPVWDTMLGEYVIYGNLPAEFPGRYSLALDACARRRGWPAKDPVVDALISHGVNPVRLPKSWLLQRCQSDVETTERLFLAQRQTLLETNRTGALQTRCSLTPVLAELEGAGLCLDPDRVAQSVSEYRAKLADLTVQAERIGGTCNWRSGKQVGELIYDRLGFEELRRRNGEPIRTTVGARKTDAKTLAKLKASTPEQKAFLEVRKELSKVQAALDKNLECFNDAIRDNHNLLFANFNQTRTATHRLSSTGSGAAGERSVQFQNLPRSFKPLFIAKQSGYLLGEIDGAQLEFRVAAFLGNDERAKADINDPAFDIHVLSGSEMAQTGYSDLLRQYRAGEKGASKIRQDAKPDTFKPLYGGEYGTPAQMRWYDAFKARYTGIARTQEDWVSEVLAHKVLVTDWGMRYFFPGATISASGHVSCKSQVYNYPVQALATAEIIPVAVRSFWNRIGDSGLDAKIRPVNTIHDSLICEVHPDYVKQFCELGKQSFTHDVYNYLERVYKLAFDVPLGCEIKIGKHWNEADYSENWNVWPDGREIRVT